nr:hypothetical protein [uncultured Polaribacter sp.]
MPKWFEYIFNTPNYHRIQHAKKPQYLDRNHSSNFIIWDRLFDTFKQEIEKPIYGLVKNIYTY